MGVAVPHVLLTGSTGFLGGATLAHLLDTRPDLTVLALVRAPSVDAAAARLTQSLARFIKPANLAAALSRVQTIAGDLMDADLMDFDTVTHVIHAAANTSFRSVRSVRRVNILGALTLAHRLRRAPRLERYLHVGTAFSCGVVPARTVLREDDYPMLEARHVVEYTSAKAEAELLLEKTAPELPLVIVRPSVIVGHSTLGCTPSGSLFWTYRATDLLRRLASDLDTPEDVIPVDYAAAALTHLLFKPTLAHRRYHVSAGVEGACDWHALGSVFARHHGLRPEEPFRTADAALLAAERDRIPRLLGPCDEARMLMALQLYYSFPTPLFDNTRLRNEGMPAPPRFADYLDLCITTSAGRSVYQQMHDDD